jgi:hypothetical protein
MVKERQRLARLLRAWLHAPTPMWLNLQPLLPSFSAKLVYCIRGLIAAAATVTFLLHPATGTSLHGAILIPVSAVICVAPTLGSSFFLAFRVALAGLWGAAFCIVCITILPTTVYSAVGAVAVATLFTSYAELNIGTKRFLLAHVIVTMISWYQRPDDITTLAALEVAGSIGFGAGVGVVSSLLPIPALATSARESGSRIRLLMGSIRNQVAAVAIAFSHETRAAVVPASKDNTTALHVSARDSIIDIDDELAMAANSATPAVRTVGPLQRTASSHVATRQSTPKRIRRAVSLHDDEIHVEVRCCGCRAGCFHRA